MSARWALDNPGNQAIHDERAARAVDALRRAGWWPWHGRRVLDLGCGEGHGLTDLIEAGIPADACVAVDPDGDRLGRARARVTGLPVAVADGGSLPFASETFDLVVAWTVFSSIADETRANRVAFEAARVLRPGGVVLWYDMRLPNPANRATHPLRRADVRRLFPGLAIDLEPATVLPQVARRLGDRAPSSYPVLAHIPGACSHLVGALRKP